MPSDDSDYEPVLNSPTTEASVEAEPVVKRDAAEKIGAPAGEDEATGIESGPRAPRVWNDKSRTMFRSLVKASQAGEVDVGDDLQPMTHTPAKVEPPAPAAPAAPPAAAAAPLAPVTPPAGMPALPDLPLPAAPPAAPAVADPKLAEREAAIAAREAQLAEREKLMPDRTALAERPAETLAAWLKDSWGIADDAEMKLAMTDLITELSERVGVKLPDELKSSLEGRKALRSVKAWKETLTKREQALADQRAAQDKAATEAREAAEQKQRDEAYINRIGELIAPAKEQHKFLHDPEVTGGVPANLIVYEVLKEQQRLGEKPDLAKATEYANDYYKRQAEAAAKKAAYLQSLLAPATPAPAAQPAKATTSPGGAPGPAPTTPAAPQPVEWDPADLPMDRQQRRHASLAKIVAARKAANQSA